MIRTLAVTSRRNYFRSVKRCTRWAKVQGYDINPIADMEVPCAESKTVCITQREFDVLMSFVRNESFADILTVTWRPDAVPKNRFVWRLGTSTLRINAGFPKSESKMKRMTRVVYMTDNVSCRLSDMDGPPS